MSGDFYYQCMTSFNAAARRNGIEKINLELGGKRITMFCAGKKLQQSILLSLSGIRTNHEEKISADLNIYLWDGNSEIDFPCQKLKQELDRYRDKVSVINEKNIHLQYNPVGEIVSLIDIENREAFYFAPDANKLPDYEVCTPMRMIMNWFCKMNGMLFIHAAGIGYGGNGALLVGKSGAGKSTTALLSLIYGLEFIGDDYVAISIGEKKMAYQIYRGSKIMDKTLPQFSKLLPYIIKTNKTQEKNVVILPNDLGHIVPALQIKTIIRPRVEYALKSSFKKYAAMQILTEFATSTILQMPGCGEYMLRDLGQLCQEIPAYTLSLSKDFQEIAESLKVFISEGNYSL